MSPYFIDIMKWTEYHEIKHKIIAKKGNVWNGNLKILQETKDKENKLF